MGKYTVKLPAAMNISIKTFFLSFFILSLLPQMAFPQEDDSSGDNNSQTIPETLRRPERGETPRYPRDVVIGVLGQGQSPDDAYKYAQDLLSTLLAGTRDAQIVTDNSTVLTESLLDQLGSIEPQSYRIGSGRIEEDGSVSYLVRFLGQNESITGELFLRQANAAAPGDNSASGGTSVSSEDSTSMGDSTSTGDSTSGGDVTSGGNLVSSGDQASAGDQTTGGDIVSSGDQTSGEVAVSGNGKWRLDDLVLEEKRLLTEIRDSYRYDFSPYERFY